MTRDERRKLREAWAKYRAGRGPRPPSRAPHPGELRDRSLRETRHKAEAARDPVQRADERRDVLRLREEHGRLVEMLKQERKRNAFLKTVGEAREPPRVMRTEKASGLREAAFVALASDWHIEEEVAAVKAGGRNEYNLAIADQSIRRFFQSQVDLVNHHRASKKLMIRDGVLALMGDFISGHIHEDLIETTQLSPVEAVIWLKSRLQDGIKHLVDELGLRTLTIPFSYGNHGRTTEKKRIATGAEHSYEWMLGRMLEMEFARDRRIRFDTNPSIHQYAQVYDYTLHFTHGDSVGYGGGIGGITIPLNKAKFAWDDLRYAHYSHCGHWHQLKDLGRVLVNGSLIGYNAFSAYIRASFEPPQQLFYLLDSKRGKCHVTPLWVRELAETPPMKGRHSA